MTLDFILFIVWNTAFLIIGALGVGMVFSPPKEENIRKRRRWQLVIVIVIVIGLAASAWGKLRNDLAQQALRIKTEQAQTNFFNSLQTIETRSNAILGFVANPPAGATKEDLQAFAKAYVREHPISASSMSAGQSAVLPESPPPRVSDTAKLKNDVAAFTTRLRERETAYLKDVAETKDPNHVFTYQGKANMQSIYEDDFRANYRPQAVELRDKLLKSLNQPPTFVSALDRNRWSWGDQQLGGLADYLDDLASQLK